MFLAPSLLFCATIAGCFSAGAPLVEHENVAFDVSPNGEQVAFASAEGDIFLLELNSRKVTQLTKTVAVESSPAYSPDGKTIIYAAAAAGQQSRHISRILLDGTNGEQLTNEAGVSDWIPKFSPNGLQIVFARAHRHRRYSMGGWTWDNWDVYIMDADGGKVRRLTNNNYYRISGVEFSRNGNSILFSAASDLGTNVFDVSVEGSTFPKPGIPQPASPGKYGTWASEPDCSPDGKKIVVISDRATRFHYDLVLIDVASGNAKALRATSVSRYNTQPVFTPDGRQILFLAGTVWNSESRPIFSLWSIDVAGGNAKEIAGSQLFTNPMTWSPPK